MPALQMRTLFENRTLACLVSGCGCSDLLQLWEQQLAQDRPVVLRATMTFSAYTIDSFDVVAQTSFKHAIAETLTGVISIAQISITKISVATRRRRLASGIVVAYQITGFTIATKTAAETQIATIASSPATFSATFNSKVVERGAVVPAGNSISGTKATVVMVSESPKSQTQGDSSEGGDKALVDQIGIPLILGIAGAGLLLCLGGIAAWRLRRRSAADKRGKSNTKESESKEFRREVSGRELDADAGIVDASVGKKHGSPTSAKITVEEGSLGIAVLRSAHREYGLKFDRFTGKDTSDVQAQARGALQRGMVLTGVSGIRGTIKGLSFEETKQQLKHRPITLTFELNPGATVAVQSPLDHKEAGVSSEHEHEDRQECGHGGKGQNMRAQRKPGRSESVEAAVDPSTGRAYYYNKFTQKTGWTAEEVSRAATDREYGLDSASDVAEHTTNPMFR